jgi:imidazolonepropionase-like amidohydrolase
MGETLIVTNVSVIDGRGGAAVRDAEVVISDGVFRAVRPRSDAAAERDAVVFDGRGGYLVPGLWEGHTHLRVRPGEAPEDQIARLERILADYLRAGITTVLELGGPIDIDGRLREKHRTTPKTSSAELLFAGPSFTGINGWPLGMHGDHTLVREVDDAESARRMVLELDGATDFVKCIYDGEPGAPDKLPRKALDAIVAAAHERGKKVLVHIRTSRDIEEVIDAQADCIEHSFVPRDAEDAGEAKRIAALMARNGTYFSPTLTIFEQIGRSGDPEYLDELERDGIIAGSERQAAAASPLFGKPFLHHPQAETLERFHYAMRAVPIMLDAGVTVVAGSDLAIFTGRPNALLREVQLLARAGMPSADVIVAATRGVAEKIGKAAGTIEPGRSADAFIVNADPIANIDALIRPEHRVATIRLGVIPSGVEGPPPA